MLKRFLSDESGAALIEYGIIIALVAIVASATLAFLGNMAGQVFQTIFNVISSIPL